MANLILESMTVINKRNFYGTKGANENKPFWVIDVLQPLPAAAIQNGSFGYEIKTFFLEKEQWLKLDASIVGQKVSFTYGSDDYGNPVVTGINFSSYLTPGK